MKRPVAFVVALAILGLVPCAASAAVLVDQAWTTTSQIISPTNKGPFQWVQNLAAINLHYGSRPAGGTLNGIGFLDVVLTPYAVSPANTATGASSGTFAPGVTVDYDLSGDGDNRPLSASGITGADATVANNVAYDNRYFGNGAVPYPGRNTMTFHGLGPNQTVYVQVVGGQHGWNQNTTVFANGLSQGVWNSNKTNQTAGLFGFLGRADAGGNLTVDLKTSQFGGMAAIMLSSVDSMPSLPVTSGLQFWVNSDSVDGLGNSTLANGANVSRWANLAPAVDATTTSNFPTFQNAAADRINGHPVVRFNGTNDYLQADGLTLTNDKTLFAVYRAALPGSTCCGTVLQAGEWNNLGAANVGGVLRPELDVSGSVALGTSVITNTPILGVANFFSSGTVGQQLYVNGRLEATRNGPQATTNSIVRLGYRNIQQYDGDIAEAIIYNGVLTPTQRLWVSKYLSDKYALPLVVDERLSDTSQVVTNPFGDSSPLVQAVNFRYTSAPVTGSFQGIRFDNVDLSGAVPPTGPINLTANLVPATLTLNFPLGVGANTPRTQSASFTGTDAATLAAVANEMYYIGTTAGNDHPGVTMTLSGLWANHDVYVQVIGGDGGWNGDLLVKANGLTVGTWTDVADNNTATASLFGFFAKTDSAGQLALEFTVPSGNFAGISGIIITERVPEPSTIALFALGAVALAPLVRRRRAR